MEQHSKIEQQMNTKSRGLCSNLIYALFTIKEHVVTLKANDTNHINGTAITVWELWNNTDALETHTTQMSIKQLYSLTVRICD